MKAERLTRRGPLSTAAWMAVVLCVLISIGSIDAQEASPARPRTPEQIIVQLVGMMENKAVDPRFQQNQVDRLIDELSKLGDKAIPTIKSALVGAKLYVQSALMHSLRDINTPLATDTLLEFAIHPLNKLVSEIAIGGLSLRTIHRPLSRDEFSQLVSELRAIEEPRALGIAEILSRCKHNDVTQRAAPIITRFIWQLGHPPRVWSYPALVSSKAWWCNKYILCLRELDQGRVRELLKGELAKTKDKHVAIWLTIALGMLGEESVTEELRRIVESEADISMRELALSGYAMAAKDKAIPFLRHFITARSSGGAESQSSDLNHLQMIARNELGRLEEKRP
ncbi:MAG: hypothetical protein WC429_04880 [Verrucomicrobiia bacterium]